MKLIRTILVLLTLGLISFVWPAQAKHPYDENYFTNLLIKKFDFKAGPSRGQFRPDLFKDDYVIEVDWEHKMYEAIGQSLVYSIETGKKPAIIILDDRKKNVNYSKFKKHLKELGIKLWIADVDKKKGKIHSLKEA